MADPVLSVIAELVLKNLGHLVIRETRLLCGFKRETEKLRDTVSAITATLDDLENGLFTVTNAVRDWQGKLKDVLYDADDVLDGFRTEALRQKLDESITKKVRSLFSCSNLFVYNLKMGHRIKHIRERLDNIEKDRSQFEPRAPHNQARLVDNVHQQRETDSILPSSIFGRDKNKEEIVKLLTDCGSEDYSVIPIVGPGGIGKTTLAQMVFNDDKIKGHFELRIWVCVSTDFDKKKITEKILESVTGEKCASLQMETLQSHLSDKLCGKRYLLVLDDLWNEDHGKWVELKELLVMSTGKKGGSKILVTTRSKDVAKVVCPTLKSYDLSFLPVNESWYVFKRRALIPGLETPALEKIGKEIVGKCGGLPLALSALGSLLHGNVNEDDWKYVRDNEMWRDLIGKELNVLPILKFSYDNLPSSQLKQCFAYCSLFPKDDDITKEMLILLWMAQGFLQSSNPRRRMEDTGNHYFKVLLSRSFFHDVEEDDYLNMETCKMHDLMHDLAQSVSRGECLIVDEIDTPIPACVRHMGLSCDTYQGLSASHKLRTFYTSENVEVSHDAWSSLRYVRVLMLSSVTQEQLCSISELKHLRFLGISGDSIKKLPKSIIMLQNLQTLYVMECGLEKLPKDIGKIESLRHIYLFDNDKIETLPDSICKLTNLQSLKLSNCSGIKRLPKSIGELTNLDSLVLKDCDELEALPEDIGNMVGLRQLELDWYNESICIPSGVGKLTRLCRLPLFIVGKHGDRSHPSLSELHGLNNLKRTLSITNLGNATTLEGKEAKLRDKQYLESLSLEWNTGSGGDGSDDVEFLEALEPNQNIQVLKIDGYGGASFPPWMMKMTVVSFPHLSQVELANCTRCYNLPSILGQLPSLVSLFVHCLEELEYIKNYAVSGGSTKFFPSLKELYLIEMRNLKEWSRIEEIEDEDDVATKPTTSAAKTVAQEEQRQQVLLSFPCLSRLTIRDCPKLETMPFHPCVVQLTLQNFSGNLLQSMMMVATPIKQQPITTSSISSFSPLEKLESLHVEKCNDKFLLEEGLRGLTSLRSLSIEKCHGLISLSQEMQCLTALEELSIEDCQELNLSEEDGMHGLQSLQALEIKGLPKLVSLPEGLQHATHLRSLRIHHCGNLMTLPEWIGNFASLEELDINECPNVQSLPQGMQRLTKLRELYIFACPHLSRRCERGVGEDWHKIAHILSVGVDD